MAINEEARNVGATNPPLSCSTCNSTYSRLEHLRRHMATHSDDKPFECKNCRRRYRRRDVWKRHEKTCTLNGLSQQSSTTNSSMATTFPESQSLEQMLDADVRGSHLDFGSSDSLWKLPHFDPDFGLDMLDFSQHDIDCNDTTTVLGSFRDMQDFRNTESRAFATPMSEGVAQINKSSLPSGLTLLQLDPFEGHRVLIQNQLEQKGEMTNENQRWLDCSHMKLCVGAYFRHFHPHVPMIHLPRFNISTVRTHLFISMVLVGSFYTCDGLSKGSQSHGLYDFLEKLAWDTAESDVSDEHLHLDTVQALYLLAMLDSAFVSSSHFRPAFDFERLISLARDNGYLEENLNDTSYEGWTKSEARRRTMFAIYFLDVSRAVFHNERPLLQAHEVRLRMPTHEIVFNAATPKVWQERLSDAESLCTLDYPLIIWTILLGRPLSMSIEVSMFGLYALLHGLLVFIWETAQVDPEPKRPKNVSPGSRLIIQELASHRKGVLDTALCTWRGLWQVSTDIKPSEEGYEQSDRALVFWYFACFFAKHDSPFVRFPSCSKDAKGWATFVPNVLKNIVLLERSGGLKDADTSDKVVERLPVLLRMLGLDRDNNITQPKSPTETMSNSTELQGHQNETQENSGGGPRKENMDELVVNFILSPDTRAL